jgi:hypothetical protein
MTCVRLDEHCTVYSSAPTYMEQILSWKFATLSSYQSLINSKLVCMWKQRKVLISGALSTVLKFHSFLSKIIMDDKNRTKDGNTVCKKG